MNFKTQIETNIKENALRKSQSVFEDYTYWVQVPQLYFEEDSSSIYFMILSQMKEAQFLKRKLS